MLLDLMSMNCQSLDDLQEVEHSKIRARYQASFWNDLLKHFSSLGSEAYKLEKLKQFEPVFTRLVDLLVK